MIFTYSALTQLGEKKKGTVEAPSRELAISALQRRDLIISSLLAEGESKSIFKMVLFQRVPVKEVVILSRQIATLFEAKVSALKAFKLLAGNTRNELLNQKLNEIVDDIQAGANISDALKKHPDVFSNFYVNMVGAGEESGTLNETFNYLADYLDRQYALTKKMKNALIYPSFIIFTFVAVMVLMFTLVIPKLSQIILESGQEIPVYTKIVLSISDFLVNYGIFVLILAVIGVFGLIYLARSKEGQKMLDRFKLSFPIIGDLYKKFYLARIADNLETMLSSGIPILRTIEITGAVVGNRTYQNIMEEATEAVKSGTSLSESLSRNEEIPNILVQMIQIGEETGSISTILKTLAKFYEREVNEAVDTLVSMIEPVMIVLLGLGVGVLLASVLMPIYNISSGVGV
jgi:type IV pilus assembly protein PilC